MNALALQRDGEGLRLSLSGDWSLGAMAQIDQELKTLSGPMSGTVICDWSHVQDAGIGPVWALLTRLADLGGAHLQVRHEGNPPHTVELLQKLKLERYALAQRAGAGADSRRARSAISDAGRYCRAPKGARCSAFRPHRGGSRPGLLPTAGAARAVDCTAYLRDRRHRHSDRLADRVPDQRGRRVSRRAAACEIRRRPSSWSIW